METEKNRKRQRQRQRQSIREKESERSTHFDVKMNIGKKKRGLAKLDSERLGNIHLEEQLSTHG